MRGQQTFQSLFPDLTTTCPDKVPGKGRNPEYDAKRNELLLARYFFYGKYTSKRYSWIIAQLASEFFLAQRRITDIIAENTTGLKQLRDNPPTIKELRQRWSHLVWDI